MTFIDTRYLHKNISNKHYIKILPFALPISMFGFMVFVFLPVDVVSIIAVIAEDATTSVGLDLVAAPAPDQHRESRSLLSLHHQ